MHIRNYVRMYVCMYVCMYVNKKKFGPHILEHSDCGANATRFQNMI
jgi:hypothetical protein